MEPAVRLAVLDALSAMAAEVTAALDGDVLQIRVRGRDPEVVVTPAVPEPTPAGPVVSDEADDGATARISLRLPDALKTRPEGAAAAPGTSLNSWLGRAVASAVDPPAPGRSPGRGPHRF